MIGAELANLMYGVPAALADTERSGPGLWLGEVVATAGLVVLVLALVRTGRTVLVAPAVGAYIGAAYWFTSSTSFANPAVTVGRVFSDTFAGIAPSSVPGFVLAQVVGGAVGLALALTLYPGSEPRMTPQVVFACRRNGGRSVISRVLTEHYAGGRVVALSAGTEPGEQIHPEVARALADLGLDTSRSHPSR